MLGIKDDAFEKEMCISMCLTAPRPGWSELSAAMTTAFVSALTVFRCAVMWQ